MSSAMDAAVSPKVWREWRDALAILLAGAVLCLLLDALVFRTRFYTRILDPHTSTGSFEFALSSEAAREYWARPVLVLGNSIIVQGFSPRLANWSQLARGYQFSSVAVPATWERCWYYLLRDLDPERKRYSVIVVPVESYDDRDLHEEDFADHIIDARFLAVRLKISDVPEFAASFRSLEGRLEAARLTLFKGLVYRNDLLAFLEHPRDRIAEVKSYRRYGDWETYLYDGLDRSLAGLSVDWNKGTISLPGWLSANEKQIIKDYFLEPVPPQRGYLGEYRRRWLGRIVERYQGTGTRILIMRMPFNALARRYAPGATGRSAVRDLASRPGVYLLDEHSFDEFERPELFADLHHLNAAGRARFSTTFARLFAEALREETR
jgi:hypothetical protein